MTDSQSAFHHKAHSSVSHHLNERSHRTNETYWTRNQRQIWTRVQPFSVVSVQLCQNSHKSVFSHWNPKHHTHLHLTALDFVSSQVSNLPSCFMAISTQDIHVVLYHHDNILASSQIHINSKPSKKYSFPNRTKSGEAAEDRASQLLTFSSWGKRVESGNSAPLRKPGASAKTNWPSIFEIKKKKKDLQLVVCWEILCQHQEPWRNKTKDGSKKCALQCRGRKHTRATSKSIPSFEIWSSNVNPQILLMNSSKSKKRSVFTASEGDSDITHPMYPIYACLSSVCKSLLHFALMYVVQWFLSYFLSTGVNMRGVGLKWYMHT